MHENEVETIGELNRRYDSLRQKKTQAETLLQNAMDELDKLKSEARQRYGTDELDQLRDKLREMEEENLRKRKEYQRLLKRIEEDLAKVEAKSVDEQ
jgi:cell division septum initiation protein DivIVA